METIKIEEYLTQAKLESALKQILPTEHWLGKEIRHDKYRWDMGYKDKHDAITVVEFDGDSHYRDALVVKRDRIKDSIAHTLGYKTVRIPYWVQLTSDTLKFYFGFDAKIEQNFPHGFITTKHFPASFCDLGLERFIHEMCNLPESVSQDVIHSLSARAKEYGMPYVIPTKVAQNLIPFQHTEPQYYSQYLKLGGKKAEDEFCYHLEVFFCLTLDAYTSGIGSRELAFTHWCEHIGSFEEASRFFKAVDSIHAYS
jgi:hypothetical protein